MSNEHQSEFLDELRQIKEILLRIEHHVYRLP